MTTNRHIRLLHFAIGVGLVFIAGACGAGTQATSAQGEAAAAEEPTPEGATEPTPTAAPEPTAVPTPAATEVPVEPTPEPTVDACGTDCFSDEERERVNELLDVYNSGEWDAFVALMGPPEPEWESDLGAVETMYIEADFEWSRVLEQEITLEDCDDREGQFVCFVMVEDAVHRAFHDQGLEPSRCRMDIAIDDKHTRITYYNIGTCFLGYDGVFHDFGAWFEATYPDQATIQGFHYRAWNQFGEGAPERAAAHIEEFRMAVAGSEVGGGHSDHGG